MKGVWTLNIRTQDFPKGNSSFVYLLLYPASWSGQHTYEEGRKALIMFLIYCARLSGISLPLQCALVLAFCISLFQWPFLIPRGVFFSVLAKLKPQVWHCMRFRYSSFWSIECRSPHVRDISGLFFAVCFLASFTSLPPSRIVSLITDKEVGATDIGGNNLEAAVVFGPRNTAGFSLDIS